MLLENIPNDLILNICNFIDNKQSIYYLIRTSSHFEFLHEKSSCFKYIKFNLYGENKNFINFIKFCCKNKDYIERLTIEGVDYEWLSCFSLPKELILKNCCIGNIRVDIPESCTETLIIEDLHRDKNKTLINIEWGKLLKLKVLDLKVYDINFTGIELCKNIEVIRIDLGVDRHLPNFFADFQNLKLIATTCFAVDRLHFVSEHLKICLVNKKYTFTTNSKIVPESHLGLNFMMNIQSLENLVTY
jgi:hypothetical protein